MSYLISFMEDYRKTFNKIYNQYIEKIYRFIFLKVNSQEVAEDLTSETFLRVFESLKNQEKIENPQAFLYRIARNLVTDYYREKRKTQIISPESVSIRDPRPGLEEKMALNSDLEQIKASLANLKEDYQNVIIWHYLDGLSIPEVAKLLGRTEEATRVLLHRALKTLREKIESS